MEVEFTARQVSIPKSLRTRQRHVSRAKASAHWGFDSESPGADD